MSLSATISLVTLGVADVPASTRFYEALGFERSPASVEGEVSFFRTSGAILALWGAEDLAIDAGREPRSADGFRGTAIAVNVVDRAAVDDAFRTATSVGAEIVKAPEETEWGGYQGYFADPDGHLWEVAHNPDWPLGANGLPQLP